MAFFTPVGRYMRGRHHVRILRVKTTITFGARGEEGAVCGYIETATTYQSRRDGLTSLRLQKFITEPTRYCIRSIRSQKCYGPANAFPVELRRVNY